MGRSDESGKILKIKHEYGLGGGTWFAAIVIAFMIGKVIEDLYQIKMENKYKTNINNKN